VTRAERLALALWPVCAIAIEAVAFLRLTGLATGAAGLLAAGFARHETRVRTLQWSAEKGWSARLRNGHVIGVTWRAGTRRVGSSLLADLQLATGRQRLWLQSGETGSACMRRMTVLLECQRARIAA
jgi:hypothetical protein